MGKIINGIQQIGIGVKNVNEVFNWYRKNLGFDVMVFNDEATATLMAKYTGDEPRKRKAALALNMIGGGGLEIWQFKDREPLAPVQPILLGDLGINMMKLRSKEVVGIHNSLKELNLEYVSEIDTLSYGFEQFIFADPWGNLVQVLNDDYCFSDSKSDCGGVLGAVIGVSNMDKSISFYKDLLGFDIVEFDKTQQFDDFKNLPEGYHEFRRVLLKRGCVKKGGFGELFGPSEIELIQVLNRTPNKIYKDRFWGDLGYIHLCFDVHGMEKLRNDASDLNYAFTVDSADSFDMGDAAGHFSYVEDPDGTLIEFVETHKVPILKSLGIYVNLKKRNPQKPLPRWLVKAMKVHQVKKDI